jgi:hypothetical protein
VLGNFGFEQLLLELGSVWKTQNGVILRMRGSRLYPRVCGHNTQTANHKLKEDSGLILCVRIYVFVGDPACPITARFYFGGGLSGKEKRTQNPL